MADDDDDELFTFTTSKPRMPLEDVVDLSNDDYYKELVMDADSIDTDIADSAWNKRKRPAATPKGLAQELIAGNATKRIKKLEKDDDIFVVEDKSNRNDSSEDEKNVLSDSESSSIRSLSPSAAGYTDHSYSENYEAMRLMDSVDDTLYALKHRNHRTGGHSADSSNIDLDLFDVSTADYTSDEYSNLRIRCRGKVHTFENHKNNPFSIIVSKLSKIYDNQDILLQFKSNEVKPTDTMNSLKLSTVDILDAFVLDKSYSSTERCVTASGVGKENFLNVKIQTSKKAVTYSVKIDEPLDRILREFAYELNIDLCDMRFTFDGDSIKGSKSAQEFDMEDGDVIDAAVINH